MMMHTPKVFYLIPLFSPFDRSDHNSFYKVLLQKRIQTQNRCGGYDNQRKLEQFRKALLNLEFFIIIYHVSFYGIDYKNVP